MSYTAPHILQMKDGLSWVAFEFAKKQAEGNVIEGPGRQPIAIIPTGITYTNKNKWRHEVIVEYVLFSSLYWHCRISQARCGVE